MFYPTTPPGAPPTAVTAPHDRNRGRSPRGSELATFPSLARKFVSNAGTQRRFACSSAGLDRAALIGEHDGLRSVPKIQLTEDASNVGAHGGLADDEK